MIATRYKKGDRVKVKGIIFPMGGHWRIPITKGTIVSVERATKDKPFVDYEVRLDGKPRGFGYNKGYARASDVRKL